MTSPILEELKETKRKIRALETELSRVIADREIALARVAELEAELAELRAQLHEWYAGATKSQREKVMGWLQLCEEGLMDRDERIWEATARAEKAEARAAKLKELVQQVGNDHHRGNDPACEDAIELLTAFEAREREAR